MNLKAPQGRNTATLERELASNTFHESECPAGAKYL
jgi:hypothetical protein